MSLTQKTLAKMGCGTPFCGHDHTILFLHAVCHPHNGVSCNYDKRSGERRGMKKIPTLFERDWDGDRSRVVDKLHADCHWVARGEGIATRKLDGACCLIRDAKLYKRRELREGETTPLEFECSERDETSGKTVGWVPVGEGPDDRWFREGYCATPEPTDGTYELLGPKVQGNPEHFPTHLLVAHRFAREYGNAPRTFEGLREWLAWHDIEGLVFHHPDGRMAKIKQRDFGLKRKPESSGIPL